MGRGTSDPHRGMRKKEAEECKVSTLYGDCSMSLKEILMKFPKELKQVMGDIEIPDNNGLNIGESIVKGTCIAASDRGMKKSLQEVRGGHGYAIGMTVSKHNLIKGIGACPLSDRMSPQTAKHYGLLGVLCVLHAMCIRYQLMEDECFGEVVVLIDNKNVAK